MTASEGKEEGDSSAVGRGLDPASKPSDSCFVGEDETTSSVPLSATTDGEESSAVVNAEKQVQDSLEPALSSAFVYPKPLAQSNDASITPDVAILHVPEANSSVVPGAAVLVQPVRATGNEVGASLPNHAHDFVHGAPHVAIFQQPDAITYATPVDTAALPPDSDSESESAGADNAFREASKVTQAEGSIAKKQAEEAAPLTFPQKMVEMLSTEEYSNLICWLPHGKGFVIRDKKKFAEQVLPKHFKKSKFTSFTRKLNRWNFTRVTRGPETGAYYHPLFHKGDTKLAMQMTCINSKSPQQLQPMNPIALGMGNNSQSGNSQGSHSSATGTMLMLPGTNIGMVGPPASCAGDSLPSEASQKQGQSAESQLLHQNQPQQGSTVVQQMQQIQQLQHPNQPQTGSLTVSSRSSDGSGKMQQDVSNTAVQQQSQQQQNQQQSAQFGAQMQIMQNQQFDMNSVVMNAFSQQQQQYYTMFLSQQQQMAMMNATMGMQLQQQQQQLQYLQNQNQNMYAHQQNQQNQQKNQSLPQNNQGHIQPQQQMGMMQMQPQMPMQSWPNQQGTFGAPQQGMPQQFVGQPFQHQGMQQQDVVPPPPQQQGMQQQAVAPPPQQPGMQQQCVALPPPPQPGQVQGSFQQQDGTTIQPQQPKSDQTPAADAPDGDA